MSVQFEEELTRILPADLPNRERLIRVAAIHLEKIVAANEYMNLTRITAPLEAAIKHVYDCVAPWRSFSTARRILDAGTGAGFPGVPLSVILPATRFTLAESVSKKARFVGALVEDLELDNIAVRAERAEAVAAAEKPDVITARAMAPIPKLIDLFRRSLKNGSRLLLYKGPEVESELRDANVQRFVAKVVDRYELPAGLGTRTLVEIRQAPR